MEIHAEPHSVTEMIRVFCGSGFEFSYLQECHIGEPERALFVRAGKEKFFDAARALPAILILHFWRSSTASGN
jgi:hypothetical protein